MYFLIENFVKGKFSAIKVDLILLEGGLET